MTKISPMLSRKRALLTFVLRLYGRLAVPHRNLATSSRRTAYDDDDDDEMSGEGRPSMSAQSPRAVAAIRDRRHRALGPLAPAPPGWPPFP